MKKFLRITHLLLFASILILSAVFLQTIPVVRASSQFMDYFTTTPVIGSLSLSCWGAAAVGPRDQSNGLEDRTISQWCYWDGGIIKGPDGLYHMFASRWSQSAGHNGWFGSVAVHATSSNLYGPYTDQGLVWPNDASGQGHNVLPIVLKDGRYAIYCSETRRPAVVYVATNLNGPWTKLGTVSVTGPSASGFTHSNVYIMLRPDGRYGIISRDALVGVANDILGPYNITGTNIYAQTAGMPTGNVEDPCMWYSGGLYHVVANKWDTRKAYHLTSPDGISNWKLDPGFAYDPTASFIRYPNGTVNHWNKLERFNVYMENGHVVAVTLAAIDVAKDQELGNDQHGSKVIVIPFDGTSLDSGGPTPTPVSRPALAQIEAESYNSQSGIENESCSDGGQNIGYIENGDYALYNNVDFGSGVAGFQTRVASATSGGSIEIRLDSVAGTLVGTCPIIGTGGWQTWVTATCNVGGVSGTHNLYLRFIGGSGYLFNVNWFQFTNGTPTPSATPTPVGSYVRLRNVATGLYIDGMGSTANGSNACQGGNSNSANQQWTIINSGSYAMLQNRATGLYLDGMGSTSNGAACGQWGYSGSANQQWTIINSGSYVRIQNRATGLYLDGMGSTSSGSNLCQWSNSGSTNQQWQTQ